MKAAVRHTYGSPEVVSLRDIPKPTPAADEVRVEVKATSLNASDWESLTGWPLYIRMWGLRRPRFTVLGSDIAGTVEAVGENVTALEVGDDVFGDVLGRWGGLAEFACVPESAMTLKPPGMSFEVASTVPQAGLVALQGLRDRGRLRAGQSVLINGAGGGSGTFALQIAKWLGAEVTGVDSARKLETMRASGADHVIDYAREDFRTGDRRYDLILDLVACRPLRQTRRALSDRGTYVAVGGSLGRILEVACLGPLLSMGGKSLGVLAAKPNKDLPLMAELIGDGTVTPVIDRCYPLSESAEALRYLGEGQARGKVVVLVGSNS